MRRIILLFSILLLGFQFASAQTYYFNRGLDCLEIRKREMAFKFFTDGIKNGELASAYAAVICYLTETGTPRNISKAEELIGKYALKYGDLCVLAANYYGGFGTQVNSDLFRSGYVPWRGRYDNQKTDPSLALKYAHAAFEKIESKKNWDRRVYAFRVLFEYEIAGYLNNKYGFKKDVDKALDLFIQYYESVHKTPIEEIN